MQQWAQDQGIDAEAASSFAASTCEKMEAVAFSLSLEYDCTDLSFASDAPIGTLSAEVVIAMEVSAAQEPDFQAAYIAGPSTESRCSFLHVTLSVRPSHLTIFKLFVCVGRFCRGN
eukprot:SAG11_NODE_1656_length_4502_cov_2.265955_4_plen_116_part_00